MEPMKYLEELVERYPVLDAVKDDVRKAYELLEACYEQGGKLLIAGNGGSCADAEHIVGELMKGFVKRREVSDSFAECLRNADEVRGAELAKKLQGGLPAIALTGHAGLSTMKTIGLTGKDGGALKREADVSVVVPETETFKIQELHLPVYHALCLMLEERFF